MGMNIEIANKLYRLRKQNGFSQEELASRLGISRQAVSKWERAEVSPDTDNLIALARLYNISLDELLLGEDRGDAGRKHGAAGSGDGEKDENTAREDASHVSFRGGGIHVVEPDGSEVHVGIKGIYVNDTKTGEKVNVGCGHVYAEQNAAGPDSGETGSADRMRRPGAGRRGPGAAPAQIPCVEAIPLPGVRLHRLSAVGILGGQGLERILAVSADHSPLLHAYQRD